MKAAPQAKNASGRMIEVIRRLVIGEKGIEDEGSTNLSEFTLIRRDEWEFVKISGLLA